MEEKIKEQYGKRVGKDAIYQGTYSDLAATERIKRTAKMLEDFISDRENKKVLEIGAGQGHNVPMFEALGFKRENIFLNELLPDRISAIRSEYPDMIVFEGDALKIETNEKFDVVYQSTVFTSVLNNSERRKLADKMWSLLRPGGVILWYDFIYNNPSNPDVRKVSVAELKTFFTKASRLEIAKVTLAPPIGRRVGKMYNLFNLPFLRTHVLAAFRKDY
jgi:phospholipid N-methyltransferase